MTTTTPATALRITLIVVLTLVTFVLATVNTASAAPGDDDGNTTFVPIDIPTVEIPTVEVPLEVPNIGDTLVPNSPIRAVDAVIKVDCAAGVAHITFINNTLTIKTFELTVFGSKDGTTEANDIGPGIKHVHTVNGVNSAALFVSQNGKELAAVEVDCSGLDQIAPIGPDTPIFEVDPEPIDPTPVPTTTPLGPWVGTDAAVNHVVCGGSAEPNQIVVQIVNGSNGDRTFDLARSNTSTIEPRTVTLAAGESRLELFDAADGTHVVQVFVNVPILEEVVDVDCTPALEPDPGPETPEAPGGQEAAPETPEAPGGQEAAPAAPAPGASEAPTPVAPETTGDVTTINDAELVTLPAGPEDSEAAHGDVAKTPLATTAAGLPLPLVALGAGFVALVGLGGVAVGRRSG